MALATRWISPAIGIAGFYFVARLVDPHRTLVLDGRHAGYFSYVSVNLSFMLLQAGALQAFSQTLRYDQLVGALEPVFAVPMPPGVFVAGYGAWPLLVSAAQVVVCLAAASMFMGLDLHATDLVSLLTFAVLGTATMAAIGIFGAAGVVAFKAVPPTNYFVGGAASLLAGTLFPTHLFPPVLQLISWCSAAHARVARLARRGRRPVRRGRLERRGLARGRGRGVLPLSLVVLDRAVARARSDGTLAHY